MINPWIVILMGVLSLTLLDPEPAPAFLRNGGTVTLQAADCTANNTALIQNLLNDSTLSLIILQPPDGITFSSWLTGPLTFRHNGTEIHLEDNVILEAKYGSFPNGTDCLFYGYNKTNIKITGHAASTLKMNKFEYGMLPAAEWRHGINLSRCSQVTIDTITIRDTGGDGIYLGADSTNYCSGVTVANVVVDGAARNGLSVISADGLTVTDCTFKNTLGQGNCGASGPWAGVDLEPNYNTQRLANIVFDNCTFSRNSHFGFLTHMGACAGSIVQVGVTARNCTMSGNADYGVRLSGIPGTLNPASMFAFLNSDISDNKAAGIYLLDTGGANCRINFQDCFLGNNNLTSGPAPIWLYQNLTYAGGNVFFDNVRVESNTAAYCLSINGKNGAINNVGGDIYVEGSLTLQKLGTTSNISVMISALLPKAYWNLNETGGTTAYGLNGYNGTLVNMSPPACWISGRIGNGLFFDGVNNYVAVADTNDLDIGTGDFTVMAWFKRQNSTITNQRLVCKGAGSTTDKGYAFAASDTFIDALLCNGSERRSIRGYHLGVNQWNHVALVVDRDDQMKLYLNGVLAASQSISDWAGQDLGNTVNLYLGSNYGSNCFWTGVIDEVTIYKRKLNDSEIGSLVPSPGDANGDGIVDVGDLGILAANYGMTNGATWGSGDFNGDNAVDVGDLGILAANYGMDVNGSFDFNADYAKAFGETVTDDDAEETRSPACTALGLPLLAGLVLMGLMSEKLKE